MAIITVRDLRKDFNVPKKRPHPTFWTKFRDFFYRPWTTVTVLKGLSFDINEGEFVGYVGPNGAGKSTTIKILTGVVTPTSGKVEVAGFVPYKQRYQYTYNIGVVFGQRRLMEFDVPVADSFKLFKEIYELDEKTYEERLAFFSRILKIDKLMHIPVRKLSLGERMRCEIAASLLHNPRLVFLDEPTIGLDPLAKEEIRQFLKEINKKYRTTIILTTHDMDDIEETCKRIIIIDDGQKLYDGKLYELKQKYINEKTIDAEFTKITNARMFAAMKKAGNVLVEKENFLRIRITQDKLRSTVDKLMKSVELVDFTIKEPRLEHIIRKIYKESAV